MKRKYKWYCGAFWNMMGSSMMAVNTVVLNMLVGHFSDLKEVGMFSLSLTTAQVLYSLALFGANDLQMTDYQHRFRFSHYFGLKIFSTILSGMCCFFVLEIVPFGGRAKRYTLLLTSFMLVNSFAELYQSLFVQNYRLDLSGKSLFSRYFISTGVFAASIWSGIGIAAACAWMLAADIGMTLWWMAKYGAAFRDSGYGLEMQPTGRLIREALPLCLSTLGFLLIINIPKYLIHIYLPDEAQGGYSILFMPTYAMNLLGQFIFRPYLPRYAGILRDGRGRFWAQLAVHAAVIAGLSLAGGVFMWFFGPDLLQLLFGQGLEAYRGLMFLFMLSGGILAFDQFLYYIMVLLHRQKLIFRVFLFALAAALVSGWILIPALSVFGAWLSFTVGQISLMAGYLLLLSGYFREGIEKEI